MFKFIKQYAEKIDGIDIYPVISFIIFFSFFLLVVYLVVKMKKDTISELSNIPFEADELNNTNS